MSEENINLARIGGTQQSGANVIDVANSAIKVNVVAGSAAGGDASAANQLLGNASLASIDTKTPASPATSGKQDTGNTSLASIDGKITAVNTGAVVISGALPPGTNAIGHVVVDSGSIGVTQATVPWSVSATSLPLPTNAAIETGGNLATIAAKDFALESGGNLATAVTRLTTLLGLLLAQGAAGTSATGGPMMQALVADAPQSYLDGYVQPISMTSEGRVRVATSPSLLDENLWGSFEYPVLGEDFFTNEPAFN